VPHAEREQPRLLMLLLQNSSSLVWLSVWSAAGSGGRPSAVMTREGNDCLVLNFHLGH
jgi:hypothetical protein